MGKVKADKKSKRNKEHKQVKEYNSDEASDPGKNRCVTSEEEECKSSDSDYPYRDLISAKEALKELKGDGKRIRKVDETTEFKERHSLRLAISKITGKLLPGEKPKIKKTASQLYQIGKASSATVVRNCKTHSEKITGRRFIGTVNQRDVSFAMCHFLLEHDWSQAVKILYHLLRRFNVNFEDAEMKAFFTLLLNHPERRMDLLTTFVPALVKNCSESDLKQYLTGLILLPQKLAYPHTITLREPIDTKNLPVLLRKPIKYDGSDIEWS